MDHGHSGIEGEFPQELGGPANANLNRPLRIEHAIEHGMTERPAMMEFLSFERAARVAMRIDVDEAHGPAFADRLQDRIGDRMVAADGKRPHACADDLSEEVFDILERGRKIEAR